MRKQYFLIVLFFVIALISISGIKTLAEKPSENDTEKLTFSAKKSALWFKHPESEETKKDTVETSLKGKLYNPPKQIIDINKKEKATRDTAIGVVSSYFSSSTKGDAKWIASNFVDEEKDEISKILGKKEFLKERQKSVSRIESKFVLGEAQYKDYIILFVEQRYKDGEKITEPLACKMTNDGWKITNSLSNDETFDIVFAALASGEVTNNNGITLKKDNLAARIRKPEIKIVR